MTTLLGEARVRVRPDMTGFKGDLERGLTNPLAGAASLATKALAGIGAAGAVLAAGKIGMAYEDSLNNLRAVSQATDAQLREVADTAKALGADTSLTATSAADAAAAMTELAKGGLTVDEAMKAAKGTLQLAAAAGVDAAQAATLQSAALNAFNLEADQAGRVSDVLANAANAAAGEITDFGYALQAGGAVAAATGVPLEDTAAVLGILANNGIAGSDAGTLLKSALLALQSPSNAAAAAMANLGLTAYDANGEFVGMESLFQQLSVAQGRMTDQQYAAATSTLFGADAARLAGIAGREGGEGFAAMAEAMSREGSAAEVAAAKSKGLSGAIESATSQAETLAITLYEEVAPALADIVRFGGSVIGTVGDLVGVFTDLPGPVQATVLALGAAVMLKGPVSSAFETIALRALYARESIAATSVGMNTLTKSGKGLLAFFGGPWGLAFAGAAAGVTLLTSVLGGSEDTTDDAATAALNLTSALESTSGALDDTVRAAAVKDLQEEGLLDWAESTGVGVDTMVDALLGVPAAMSEVETAFADYISGEAQDIVDVSGHINSGFTEQGFAARRAMESFGFLADKTADTISSQEELASATVEAGGAMEASTAQTEEAVKALEKWLETVQKIGEGFVEPLGLYESLLEKKNGAESDAASSTEAMTESGETSWNDYADTVGISLDKFADKLEDQILAHENWRENIVAVTQRGGLEVGQALLAMGEEGALLTAQMVDATDEEFQRMKELMAREAALGGQGASIALDREMKVMEVIGRDGARATRSAISQELGIGVAEVQRIANQYGINLATGINPILRGLGKAPVNLNQQPGRSYPGLNEYFDGGYTGDGGKFEPKGVVHGGEFVFTKEETRRAGVGRLSEFAKSLRGYATGGFVSADDIPRPPGTAPFQYPISTAANATMAHAYTAMTDWLRSNAEAVFGGTAGGGAVSGAWGSLWTLVKRQIPQARINSTFRAGDPGYQALRGSW